MAVFVQQSVGFLIVLAFAVRFVDMTITFIRAHDVARSIIYGIVAFLLCLAALIALGFHL